MRARVVATAILAGLLFAAAPARGDDDPWTSSDKTKHYVVSAGIAAGGYVGGVLIFDHRGCALATGAGLGILAGVGKELADLGGYGHASWKDLAWDGFGIVTGLAVAWGIDVLVRGISPRHPTVALGRGGIAF